jgi:hypothetical protein
MTKVKIEFLNQTPWIVYKRIEKNPDNPSETKESCKFYWHCTCQGNGRHGAVDVRYDHKCEWEHHQCIHTEKSSFELQMERIRLHNRLDQAENILPRSGKHLDVISESLLMSWFRFQCVHDLSFTAAVSSEFYQLSHQLIMLGQENPSRSPEELFPRWSRRKYERKLTDFSIKLSESSLKQYHGHFVNVSFDATKIFQNHYLIIYISNTFLSKPTFLSLECDISKQKHYAKVVAHILKMLQR